MTDKQEARLYQRALNERWPVPEHIRRDVIEKLHDVVLNGDPSEVTAASRALLQAVAQNQKDEQSKAEEFARKVLEIASRVGIDIAAAGGGQASVTRAIERSG